MILALYRLGSFMPAPGVDSKQIQDFFGSGGRGSSILGLLNLFSGSALSRFSILATGPAGVVAWYNGGPMEKLFFPLVAIGVVVAVVFIQEGQRRIPIQYAKQMVGRRMTSGGQTYMPLRVNMAGVIPVIFAAAVMAFPPTIAEFVPSTQTFVNRHFQPSSWGYLLTEAILIVVFTYFY